MFNLVMGIIMVGVGVIALVMGAVGGANPVPIFFGCAIAMFGVVEIIRSKAIREREKRKKASEMDAYLRLAQEMGVVVNPITKEIVSKKEASVGSETENQKEAPTGSEAVNQMETSDVSDTTKKRGEDGNTADMHTEGTDVEAP